MPSGIIPSGYALVAGLANTGKSSLLNALTGVRLSPVASQPASTHMPITGICTPGNAQICFVDTPPLERGYDWSIMDWTDIIVLVLDIKTFEKDLEEPIIKHFLRRAKDKPVILVLGKSDFINKNLINAYVTKANYASFFTSIIPVIPPLNVGVPELLETVLANIPRRDRLFPRGILTLNSKRFLISEQIRIQLFDLLPVEIASETAVQVEEISSRDNKLYIRINLIVSRASYKGMLIGRKGHTLEEINRLSALAIKEFTGETCKLDLWVKVREAWPKIKKDLLEFGYVC